MKQDDNFIKEVFSYYDKEGRHDLVWRKKITPYKILVSEVMLQQTQVKRVEDKFKAWIKKYPTLQALKKASLQDILILWQGLGYQRRAKALFSIAEKYTKIPNSYEELLMLPSVGSYTASAVMAFAYDAFSYPVIETNIRTVLIEEFHQGEEKVHDGALCDDLERLMKNDMVKQRGARAWYYALMDYGAMLKEKNISHNAKSAHYAKQSAYKGSLRELRAKTLFAIAHKNDLPSDERLEDVLNVLIKEGYIAKKGNKYVIFDAR